MGHPRYKDILAEQLELHENKSHDYAGNDPLSNLRGCERIGIPATTGVMIRLMDKMSRLEHFFRTGHLKVKDEKIKDTLNDVSGYANLLRILIEEPVQDHLPKPLQTEED